MKEEISAFQKNTDQVGRSTGRIIITNMSPQKNFGGRGAWECQRWGHSRRFSCILKFKQDLAREREDAEMYSRRRKEHEQSQGDVRGRCKNLLTTRGHVAVEVGRTVQEGPVPSPRQTNATMAFFFQKVKGGRKEKREGGMSEKISRLLLARLLRTLFNTKHCLRINTYSPRE